MRTPAFRFTVATAAALFGWAASRSQAADDPERFFNVKKWDCSLQLDMVGQGSFQFGQFPGKYSIDRHIAIDCVLEAQPAGGAGFQAWVACVDKPGFSSASVRDFMSFDGDSCRTENEFNGSGHLVGLPGQCASAVLTLDSIFGPLNGNFTWFDLIDGAQDVRHIALEPGCGEDSFHTPTQGTTAGSQPWAPPGCNYPIGCFDFPEQGLLIETTRSFPAKTGIGGFFDFDVNVNWTIRLSGTPVELEVWADDYETWLPEGGESENQEKNRITFHAKLTAPGGGEPDARAETFTFRLEEVSAEPGVCMNAPKAAPQQGRPDLQFLPEHNPAAKWEIAGPALELTSKPGSSIQSPDAVVSSFDWGASAVLTVEAQLTTGGTIKGRLRGSPQTERILLPKRREGSKVADRWKEEIGVAGGQDADDMDDVPVGDAHRGDGLTLYEEYRGFLLGRSKEHKRTDPKVKDLFVRDDAGVSSGLRLAAAVSKLEIHRTVTKDQMSDGRVVNFNHGHAHAVEQHGIIVKREKPAFGEGAAAIGGPGLPKSISKIIVSKNLSRRAVRVEFEGRSGAVSVSTSFEAELVAHEVMHACNTYHHGETDRLDVSFLVGEYEDGTLVYTEGGREITLRTESGDLVTPRAQDDHILRAIVGSRGGQHSGSAGCLLAYKNSLVYPSLKPEATYWILDAYDYPLRDSLCSSRGGTDHNAPDHAPQSRFGDATVGCCRDQLCLNDAIGHPANTVPGRVCGPGGGAVDDEAPRGGAAEVDPEVAVSIDDAREAVVYRGWPAVFAAQILPPGLFDSPPGADSFTLAAPAGVWSRALSLAVTGEGDGLPRSWPLEHREAADAVLALDSRTAGLAFWILSPEATAGLETGSFDAGAILDTTASASGWKGRVESEPASLVVEDEPSPPSIELQVERHLAFARWRFMTGNRAAAFAEIDGALAKAPSHLGALGLRAVLLDIDGRKEEALAAYEEAVARHLEARPGAQEPPVSLLLQLNELQIEILTKTEVPPKTAFLRGDANGDRAADVSDAVAILGYLFLGGEIQGGCIKSADSDDSGVVDITDGVHLLGFLFLGGNEPPPPAASCGEDPTADGLACPGHGACGG